MILNRLAGKLFHSVRENIFKIYQVRGFRVLVENNRPDIQTPVVLQRLDEALALIERYQPSRIRHMRRDLKQFWIVRYPTRGAYFRAQRMSMIELTFLARTDISAAVVAACVIHEAMHARIDSMVKNKIHAIAREERICRRAEIDFADLLPPDLGDPVRKRAEAVLASTDHDVVPDINWREAYRRQIAADLKATNS
jgi:hypothetical protein